MDKKGHMRFVLPDGIGTGRIVEGMEIDLVKKTIKGMIVR